MSEQGWVTWLSIVTAVLFTAAVGAGGVHMVNSGAIDERLKSLEARMDRVIDLVLDAHGYKEKP